MFARIKHRARAAAAQRLSAAFVALGLLGVVISGCSPSDVAPTAATPTAEPSPTPLPSPTPTPSFEDVVELIKSYTVLVRTDRATGSGISLGNGLILTNHHVISGARRIEVQLASGLRDQAKVSRVDPRRDLALLDSGFTGERRAPIGETKALRTGATVIAAGFPAASIIGTQGVTITRGIASGLWQSPSGVLHLQTDAAVNPGNSGGPIADERGRVVGVTTFAVRDNEGLKFGVAAEEMSAFVKAAGPTSPDRSDNPTNTVNAFYEAINARDFGVAWDLLGEYRFNLNYGQWLDGYRTTLRVNLDLVELIGLRGGTATVRVTITATDSSPSGRVTSRFTGTWELNYRGGQWRLDRPNIQKVG